MKRDWLILSVVVCGFILIFQPGCQQVEPVSGPEPVVVQEPPQKGGVEVPVPEETEPNQAPEPADKMPAMTQSGPNIRFETLVSNFGDVGTGTRHQCRFPFKNVGNETLTIEEITKSCGCTPFVLTQKSYKPGESGVLKVEYHAQAVPGNVRKTLTVLSNDRDKPEVTLVIRARVDHKVIADPNKLQFLLRQKEGDRTKITLTSVDGKAFSVTEAISTGDCIAVDYDPAVEATKIVLDVKVDTEKLRNNLEGFLSISVTHPQCETVSIFYEVLPRFTTAPSLMYIFDAEPEKPTTRKLWVTNNYGEKFDVESITSEDDSVKMLRKSAIRDGYEIFLEITSPEQTTQGISSFAREFQLNLTGGEKLSVAYRGFFNRQ